MRAQEPRSLFLLQKFYTWRDLVNTFLQSFLRLPNSHLLRYDYTMFSSNRNFVVTNSVISKAFNPFKIAPSVSIWRDQHQTMKNNSKTNFIFILFIIHVKYPLPGNRLRKKKHYSSQRSTIWMEIDGRIKQPFASFLMARGIKKYSTDFVLTPANLLEYETKIRTIDEKQNH